MSLLIDRSRLQLARMALSSLWRKVKRPLGWALLIAYLAFAGIFLTLRHVVLPHIADYRGDIEQALSTALQLPVKIDRIDADWQGLRPRLLLNDLQISDKAGQPALGFNEVEAILGWRSLLYLDVRLHRLVIDAPVLNIRRDVNGQIFIAGLPLNTEGEDSRASDWILAQGQIIVRDATIQWDDAQRKAPTLSLNKVNLNLRNSGNRHRFGFTAEPPPALAARLDLRGDFKGRDLDKLDSWKGQVYAELDYADLAIWRTWVDYPVTLPRGSGGLRLWVDFAAQEITGFTADLALAGVQIKLGRDLPMLDLDHLHGRLSAQRDKGDYSVEARKLTLATHAGLSLGPVDFSANVSLGDDGLPNRMDAQCSSLDLGKLDALAAYLPLPAEYSKLLDKLELEGRIDNLSSRWNGPRKQYSIKGNFYDLGIASYDTLPGVRKLTGSIDGDNEGGTLILNSRNAQVSLPSIFPEADIPLHRLNSKLRWQRDGQKYDVNIEDMRIANQDLEGTLLGRYRGKMGTPGEIDLSAQLTRADGRAVWRYLPLAVNKDARDWVKQGITNGHSKDVKLTLKGDLAKFPFTDGSGTFKVLVKAEDASINPSPGWPLIQHIEGDLAFIGVGMQINARKGQILGTQLSGVRAEIADLDSVTDQTLTITGKAAGPTQEFLKFIETSPVGERINHFTAPMTASGNGELDLKLKLTLHHIDDSSVEGRYRFDNNRLLVDPAMPALTEVKGVLDFNSDSITVRDARANILGAPVGVSVTTGKDGQIDIAADGQFNVPALRKIYPLPLFDQLSGTGRWKGAITVRKSDVDIRINSDLVGLSSSLPEPFNKSATTPMELRFERRPIVDNAPSRSKKAAPTARREQTEIALGKLVRGQFVRAANGTVQRGFLSVNGAMDQRMPDQGVSLSATLPRVDVDFWRRMLSPSTPAANANTTAAGSAHSSESLIPFTQIDVRTSELLAMNRTLQDVRLTAQKTGRNWKGDFRSKGVTAALDWVPGNDGGPGRISGRFPQLIIPDANQQVAQLARISEESVKQLPALAISIDKLNFHGQDWGAVTLDADNRDGYWNTRFAVNNDDGSLTGDGRWRPDQGQQDTQINFQLKAKSLEKLLTRAGYADAIRRGNATLEGRLSWNDTPFSPHYPSLNGKLKVDMQNGQFKKLEPGFGRLLGVLSLQSLPRRITLDFRDVFSEGFAFDSIRGDMTIAKGIMYTDELTINGPAAKVRMKGNVNLNDETQNLRVRVQPALGETLAVGAMLANPAVGAVAWLAQKVLRDPIDQAFAFEYNVTGKWEDPQVNKVDTGKDINKEIVKEVGAKDIGSSKDAPQGKESERK